MHRSTALAGASRRSPPRIDRQRAGPAGPAIAYPLPRRAAARGSPFTSLSRKLMSDTFLKLRYRYWPDHLLGEILSKRWTETAIPVIFLIIVAVALSQAIPGFLAPASLADTGRQFGETGLVAFGMALVIIVGGIDLSVGSMFALTDFCALYCLNVLNWPVPLVIAATLVAGGLLG